MPLDPCALTLPVPTPHTCVDSHVHGPTCQAPACPYTLQRKGVVGQAGDSQGAVGTRKGRRLLVPSARASPQRKVLCGDFLSPACPHNICGVTPGRCASGALRTRATEPDSLPRGSGLMRTAISPSDRCSQF